ncbi:regulator of nonsense transcripts 3A isoform X2 [Ceratina calcarata]|uniref:Regulator of nonsense transcripts 3A isoform X2 n=1 Tax=Ceratina calcarata TaxID=156304 RepID=A0AAJ7N434_9HYME|nr:regulator of nonsense transcripts 3A isoform X2 [Ceratina calcarata]
MTMTEETQQSETAAQNEAQTSSPDVGKVKDSKKEKCRPMTKVVIRRLPPTMTQEQFLEQVSPLPEHDYLYFVKADMSMGQYAFSRAYINFVEQQDIFMFREKFDNYVFVDSKGTEYPAVVEFAPFQRLPKKRVGKKKDLKCGTIESDPYYISFLESLKNQEAESNVSQPKTEYSYQPPDNTPKKVTTTPLLEYVKQRKQEKQRQRDEKRDERRRRDLERRRTKEDPIISKVLKNPDLDKEICKDNKENREEKDKFAPKDIKNRIKKEDKLREKIPRDRDSKSLIKTYRERIEDRNKDRDIKHPRRHEDKKIYGRRDERDGVKDDRRFDGKDDRKYDFKEDKESRERKLEEKRGKSYEKMRQEKKRLAETKKQNVETSVDTENTVKLRGDEEEFQKKESQADSYENIKERDEPLGNKDDANINKGRESQEINDKKVLIEESVQNLGMKEQRTDIKTFESHKDIEKSKSHENINKKDESEDKKDSKFTKRRSSLESGGEGGTGDGNCLRRHKSLDGGNQNNLQKTEIEDKEKDKKDPRLERRIRNKDRPAMEIYRPGMGKFSKQRLEREKSSTNDERASLSQSPTPNPNANSVSKSGKPGTEMHNKNNIQCPTYYC